MHIVATTIAVPRFLEIYRQNLDHYGHLQDVKMWVIGDRKSPHESTEFAVGQRREGLNVEYLDPDAQQEWLARFPDVGAMIPWNSDNRRNVGFLRALEEDCEILVSIDDDNFPVPESDFYAGHADTGHVVKRTMINSSKGWFNICSELVLEPPVGVVPRGYPHHERDSVARESDAMEVSLVAQAGLWVGDPDVDAATRLAFPVRAVATTGRNVALSPGTWSPINTQNTSVARRAIPAYYYVRMLEPLPGATLDRYGDIWSGYFLTRCAEHMGESIGIGAPLVRHDRNAHDLLEDLKAEFWGMMLTPHLIQVLRQCSLSGDDYGQAARSLAKVLSDEAGGVEARTAVPGVAAYLDRIASHIRTWVDVCDELA